MDAYKFDCEVEVIGELIEPRQTAIALRQEFRPRVAA